jgi:hypothetical protein
MTNPKNNQQISATKASIPWQLHTGGALESICLYLEKIKRRVSLHYPSSANPPKRFQYDFEIQEDLIETNNRGK